MSRLSKSSWYVVAAVLGALISSQLGCADDANAPSRCVSAPRALTGQLAVDVQGTWLGSAAMDGALLRLRRDGHWSFYGPAPGTEPESGTYEVSGHALRLTRGPYSRAELVDVDEASLRVLVGDEQSPLTFERVRCDEPPGSREPS